MSRTNTDSSFNVRPDKHTLLQINALTPELGAIVFDTDSNVNKYWNGNEWEFIGKANQIVVNQSNALSVLGGIILSDHEYFLDGIIDIGSTEITLPASGLTLRGYSFDISGITSSVDKPYNVYISSWRFREFISCRPLFIMYRNRFKSI